MLFRDTAYYFTSFLKAHVINLEGLFKTHEFLSIAWKHTVRTIACMQAKIQTSNTKAGRKKTNFTEEKTHNKFF